MVAVWICAALATDWLPAQPPGTPPPSDVFEQPSGDEPAALPIRAFLFMSESGNPVVMPGLTWEDLQRLMDLDAGKDASIGAYSYQSLAIRGTAKPGRAELEIVLRITVEPTDGNWVAIPLKMGNFRRVAPPDVSGADQYTTRMLPEGQGYQLMVKCNRRQDVVFRMRVTARVEETSPQNSLDFRLPDVPTKIEVTTDRDQAVAEIIGRGDESIRTRARDDGRTDLIVESSGGNFLLRWGEPASQIQPLLEAESTVTLRWPSPQDPLIAAVQIKMESLTGAIDGFQMQLPRGAKLLKPPRLGTSGRRIELTAAAGQKKQGSIYQILVPEQERRARLDLNFELQLPGKDASSREPMLLQIPKIVGALRHYGEIEIRTGSDHRLRWRSKPWIRVLPPSNSEVAGSSRGYRFRFDRESFELPIWLGRQESQVRITSEAAITIREASANLDMTIRVGGQFEGNLQLDEASWQLHAIEDLESGEPLDSYTSNFIRVIEIESAGGVRAETIRIRGTYLLDSSKRRLELPLPRVVELGDVALVQDMTVELVSSGRSVFIVDLQATGNLRRLSSEDEESQDLPSRRFQVTNVGSPLVMVGSLIEQPPQIDLVCQTRAELEGSELRWEVDWTVNSPVDLEGGLPVRIPGLLKSKAENSTGDQPATAVSASEPEGDHAEQEQNSGASQFFLGIPWDRIAPNSSAPGPPWQVTVDDLPAILRFLGHEQYEVVSDRLGSGQSVVRWRQSREIGEIPPDGREITLFAPRPDLSEVTLVSPAIVTLQSSPQFELVLADSQVTGRLQFETLPRDPLRIRVRPRTNPEKSLSIQRSLLRTYVGQRTRQEQVLASVQGSGPFRVRIPELDDSLVAEGFIDGKPATVGREADQLVLFVPNDSSAHFVDLRIWFAKTAPPAWESVAPTMTLPLGSGRVFWQIITPRDGHVIWATPTLGRSMSWRYDRWHLYRSPSRSDAQLAAMFPSAPIEFPEGNSYLYIGTDLPSFKVIVVSRAMLWMSVGSLILLTAALLSFFPMLRHPLAIVAAALLFAGLLVVAPDAAVLVGGLGVIAAVLIIVVIVIGRLMRGSRSDRVFSSGSGYESGDQRSTAERQHASSHASPQVAAAQSVSPPSPTEVLP